MCSVSTRAAELASWPCVHALPSSRGASPQLQCVCQPAGGQARLRAAPRKLQRARGEGQQAQHGRLAAAAVPTSRCGHAAGRAQQAQQQAPTPTACIPPSLPPALPQRRGLVDGQQVQACKRNMNTFAFVGDLEGSPEVSCVYHSEEAENQASLGRG